MYVVEETSPSAVFLCVCVLGLNRTWYTKCLVSVCVSQRATAIYNFDINHTATHHPITATQPYAVKYGTSIARIIEGVCITIETCQSLSPQWETRTLDI